MVYHILQDGSIVTDITGKIVKVKDAEPLYNLMANMSNKRFDKVNEKERGKAS